MTKLQESGENYLETILILKNKNGNVRSIDIATELGYTKPSISRAMTILKNAQYITVDDSTGYISLTDSGYEIAKAMYERHEILSRYLISIGVSPETATQDACRIEHVISQETFEKIKENTGNK
ncbi:iron (metal) dependent repressor, DtxR family [Ruminiclostridium papyrosolvens DSM 2782]|uniref:Iron (Metal) dependent repressor, DtxR family n=1 Tax=Ruminiclostridium papyrosolvens DSM 2782 TaxID=588581 RepID=F1TFH9_9FIRM|nr:metal-dependent transcriptional regulator [Ruminiclostridium papyrosolvens]EGD46903.1 iron (metal) dependent repressor, DtxR family [Ruminiclostridium papyrosolvens DSM 2782]WES34385.1 metal-dependent transcriptional regulator [Ruminiclostridium papyrosolvens DSM 2782]